MDISRIRQQILRQQQARSRQEQGLMALGPARAGSLLARYTHRGRIITSKSKRGLKGPYYFVSLKGKHRYVRPEELDRVRRLLGSHKGFSQGLRTIRRHNQRMEALLKRIWRQQLKKGKGE